MGHTSSSSCAFSLRLLQGARRPGGLLPTLAAGSTAARCCCQGLAQSLQAQSCRPSLTGLRLLRRVLLVKQLQQQ